LGVFVQFNGDCVPFLLYCEELSVWIIVCECLFETVCKRVSAFFRRESVYEDVDFFPVQEVAVLVVIEVTTSLTLVSLETEYEVLHGTLLIGTKAPRSRSLGMVLGAETMGAFRNVASFPFNDSEPSDGGDLSSEGY
jgi:hypothetical protein